MVNYVALMIVLWSAWQAGTAGRQAGGRAFQFFRCPHLSTGKNLLRCALWRETSVVVKTLYDVELVISMNARRCVHEIERVDETGTAYSLAHDGHPG